MRLRLGPERRRRARQALGVLLAGGLAALAVLAARRFSEQGWPLAGADDELAAAAGLLLIATYPLRIAAWRLLFKSSQRPATSHLLTANGAAYVTGAVLPSQLHHLVKVAVLKRLPRPRSSLDAIAVSLVALSVLDAVALVPLAALGAATVVSPPIRAALLAVALAGVGAAGLLLVVSRLSKPRAWAMRHRRARMLLSSLSRAMVGVRTMGAAALLLALFWAGRAGAVALLLAAMGFGFSPAAAVAVVALTAASAALPIGVLGSAVNVGTAAAVLAALGMGAGRGLDVGLASTLLVLLSAGGLALVAFCWACLSGRRRAPAADPLGGPERAPLSA